MAEVLQLERDRAYGGLLGLIMTGGIDPATPLSERKLAESMDIGRTPVREALRDLARDGVLEVRPARGTYVRRLSTDDVREMYEVRHGLEGLAALLAAERGPTPGLSAYGPIFRDMIAQPDDHVPEETYETGARFHTEIFRAAGNRQLLNIYEPLRLRFRLALGLPRFFDHQRIIPVAVFLNIAVQRPDHPVARSLGPLIPTPAHQRGEGPVSYTHLTLPTILLV